MSSAYKDLGVSAKKEAVHAATKNNDKGLFPNAFCKISPMPFGVAPEYVRIAHADGAGTKTALAYMYWKETGDMTVWHGVVQDSIVMNLDDVTCVGGVLGHFSLTSSINRNPFNIPDEVLAALIEGEKIFLSKMQKHGIRMDGQCGETADVPDLTPTLVIDNTLECIMRKEDVIDNGNIGTGDLIVGLASHGRAIYEDSYNGGMRSNGLTLARHGVLSQEYRAKYPETFYAKLGEKAYRGSKKLTDLITVDGGEQVPVGKLVLSPTRTYAPIVKEILYGGTQGISGIVHNSGGGMTKCLNYIGPGLAATKYDLFPTPALFKLIQSESNTDWKEMYQVFNMGHGMEIYTKSSYEVSRIIQTAKQFGVDAKLIGYVQKQDATLPAVHINSAHGTFSYSR